MSEIESWNAQSWSDAVPAASPVSGRSHCQLRVICGGGYGSKLVSSRLQAKRWPADYKSAGAPPPANGIGSGPSD